MVIFLVGFMGCGKSSVGRRLAGMLDYDFCDMDKAIEELAGATIHGIFASEGEEGFRKREREVLEDIPMSGDVVIATGGGAPCFGDNLQLMKKLGVTVYLKLSPENLFARLCRGRARRPKIAHLNDKELMAYIEATLAERETFYAAADLVVDCNGASDSYILSHLQAYISLREGAAQRE